MDQGRGGEGSISQLKALLRAMEPRGAAADTFFLSPRISLLTFCGGSPYKAFIDDGGGAGADGLDG
jgi:hypothetical protein